MSSSSDKAWIVGSKDPPMKFTNTFCPFGARSCWEGGEVRGGEEGRIDFEERGGPDAPKSSDLCAPWDEMTKSI
jgi:hypothetical protein